MNASKHFTLSEIRESILAEKLDDHLDKVTLHREYFFRTNDGSPTLILNLTVDLTKSKAAARFSWEGAEKGKETVECPLNHEVAIAPIGNSKVYIAWREWEQNKKFYIFSVEIK